jgi:hypothetical protein
MAFASQASFSKVDATRSLLLSALGALVGLGLAGYGLFTAKGTRIGTVPAEVVALVNQRPILVVDYLGQLQSLFSVPLSQSTPQQRQRVLNDMIREELYVQRGLELDAASYDADVRSALVSSVEQQLAADAVTRQPTDAELRSFYDRHRNKYSTEGTLQVHDLVTAGAPWTLDAAQEAVQALRRGVGLAAVMGQARLKESGKVKGEEFYFAARLHLGERLFAVARALADHGVSDPVVEPDGIHILVMDNNVVPVPREFSQARDAVLNDFRTEEIAKTQQGEAGYLRKRAEILIAPAYR